MADGDRFPDLAEITVPGFPTNIRDKHFETTFTIKRPGECTGIGLSITCDIATKALSGTIAVDSAVDEFTEFAVTLPRWMFAKDGCRT